MRSRWTNLICRDNRDKAQTKFPKVEKRKEKQWWWQWWLWWVGASVRNPLLLLSLVIKHWWKSSWFLLNPLFAKFIILEKKSRVKIETVGVVSSAGGQRNRQIPFDTSIPYHFTLTSVDVAMSFLVMSVVTRIDSRHSTRHRCSCCPSPRPEISMRATWWRGEVRHCLKLIWNCRKHHRLSANQRQQSVSIKVSKALSENGCQSCSENIFPPGKG